jgi:signal peptidase
MLSVKVWQTGLTAATWGLLRRLLYGAFVVALVALAAALATAVAPRLFGYGTLVISGGSMGDAAPVGSLVIARWMPAEEVEPGDVILIREEREDGPARPVLHRVVSLDEGGGQLLVQTKGDANQAADPNLYVLPDRVATPALTLPYLGYVAGSAMTSLGWVFLVALPAAILGLLALRSIWADEETPATEPGTM